jgi:CheY-like chemotaxis protein
MTTPAAAIRLMLVEDNDDAREVTGLMLSRRFPDMAICFANNGDLGLALFKEHAADIVITDNIMPVMDGIRMAGEIKAIKADTKLIMLAATSSIRENFSDLGFSAYLPKPLDFNELFAAIQRCVTELIVVKREN